ncbi:putative serine/threonine-protein kinase nek3 [Diplonema papillatum]|nr:putative serine/threonine-protein kinase nek3 [Diplonema papillatum]
MEGYNKIRQLGKGAMGVAHLASAPDGSLCVLKQVNLAKMGLKEKTQAMSEARLLRSTHHSNIVRYINSWTTKTDNLMIAMEYMEQGDLCTKIERSKAGGKTLWKENQVLDWFIQIALAVNYTGKKHILHRDLKTQNILVSNEGVLKLADFGISRSLVNTWDKAHTCVGTPYYLAPELVLQQPYDIQVDAWALGVVLCEMLTLSHPFNGRDMRSLTSNIVNGVYVKPSTAYSAEIRQLVTSLLQRDPKKRMTVAQALQSKVVKTRLTAWLQQDPSQKPPALSYVKRLVSEGGLDGIATEEALNEFTKVHRGSVDEKEPPAQAPAQRSESLLKKLEDEHNEKKKKIKGEFDDMDGGALNLPAPSAPLARRGLSPAARPLLESPRAALPPPRSPRAPSPVPRAPRDVSPTPRAASPFPRNGRPEQFSNMPPAGATPRGPTEQRSRFPPILGAYPGHCPPAHPRELLAEKRRALALLQQQQLQQHQVYNQAAPRQGRGRFY